MKHFILYIILGIALLSCSERQEYVDRLEQAQNLLDEHPDSALQILDSLLSYEQDFSQSFRMKFHLLRLQAQNKTDVKMDTISIVPEVVEYFSSNGSDHDKMMSNYMMVLVDGRFSLKQSWFRLNPVEMEWWSSKSVSNISEA